jgi:hypothetical protein
MNKGICTLLFCVAANFAFSQTTEFPNNIIGNWKGEYLQLNKPLMKYTMVLQIKPADSTDKYYWKIDWGGDINDSLPTYILKPIDKNQGHWTIDENGDIFDVYVHQNTFQIAFTTDGSTQLENYRLDDGKIFVEYFSFSMTGKKQSGLGTRKSPFIDSYFVGGYHTAKLEKY